MISFSSGVMLGLSLIIAIGAQNIWVLSQCMAGANRLVIAICCIACDSLLIILGVYSASELKELMPSILPWLTYGGVAMLLYIAVSAIFRAIKGNSGLTLTKTTQASWQVTALSALAISLLNPHVYLDTVLLLGSIGALQASPTYFAVGACLASFVWFASLTAFSPKLRTVLSSPFRWRMFDGTIAVILFAMAFQLLNYNV
jgi:L-lysine exporter family protein LysE/ArgO